MMDEEPVSGRGVRTEGRACAKQAEPLPNRKNDYFSLYTIDTILYRLRVLGARAGAGRRGGAV